MDKDRFRRPSASVLIELVRRHAAATDSAQAKRLLEDPATIPDKFRMHVPAEYHAALDKLSADDPAKK